MNKFSYTFTLKAYAFPDITMGLGSISQQEFIDIEAPSELEADQRAMIRVHEISLDVIERSIGGNIPIVRVDMSDFRITARDDIQAIGFFNWCDTYCLSCVKAHNKDVSTFTPLYSNDANEYDCSHCGQVFNVQPAEV